MVIEKLRNTVRDIPDFPKPGILFKDITPVLMDPVLCRELVDEFIRRIGDVRVDAIAAVESRGFLFGMTLADKLNVPFIPVRKAGKLPYKTVSYSYDLEYGSAIVEMHEDAVKPGWNVLIHDDLLATGGTAIAAAELIKSQGANIAGFAFLIELTFLDGKPRLEKYSDHIINLISY